MCTNDACLENETATSTHYSQQVKKSASRFSFGAARVKFEEELLALIGFVFDKKLT